jgi:hypothetical protein
LLSNDFGRWVTRFFVCVTSNFGCRSDLEIAVADVGNRIVSVFGGVSEFFRIETSQIVEIVAGTKFLAAIMAIAVTVMIVVSVVTAMAVVTVTAGVTVAIVLTVLEVL